MLACQPPSGAAQPVFEFPVEYTATRIGNAQLTASRARLARFVAKLNRVPAGTTFRLVCTFNGPSSAQPGWSATTRSSLRGQFPHAESSQIRTAGGQARRRGVISSGRSTRRRFGARAS